MSSTTPIDYQQLFRSLGPRVTVVTATRRLTRALQQAYGRFREAAGDTVWERPDILPWDAWLARCWDDARLDHELPAPLPGLEAQLLWEDIVAADGDLSLLRPEGAARQAMTAWEALWHSRIPRNAVRATGGEAAARFLRWGERFERHCARNDLLDASQLATAALGKLDALFGLDPRTLVLVGFDRLDPDRCELLDALRARDWTVIEAAPAAGEGTAVQRAFADPDAEIRGFCDWARARLAEQPEATIALVVRDLGTRRERVERLLDEGLAAGVQAPWQDAPERPWNISLGKPLVEAPAAADALLMLDLLTGELDLTEWGRLLRSPFFAGADREPFSRARLDRRLRRLGELRLPVGVVVGTARQMDAGPSVFTAWLAGISSGVPTGRPSPAVWARFFAGTLAGAGWPGLRTLDSTEYQCVGAVHDLLSRFAALDSVRSRLTLGEALGLLRRIAAQQVFQPAGNDLAPVQVMGVLEAAGMSFDAVWIAGAHDGQWPAPVQPLAYLPVGLQRAHGLPEADPATALTLDRAIAGRLDRAGDQVIWSWPQQAADEPLQPSPLIADLPVDEAASACAPRWAECILAAAPECERIADDVGMRLPAGSRMPGGATFFRNQAACPFRGYAMHRLGADPLDTAGFGLDAGERGALVHRVLECVWQQLGTRDALVAMDETTRRRLAEGAVDEVFAGGHRRPALGGRVAALEREYLVTLVLAWLAVEDGREDFTVAAIEVEQTIERGGLVFHVRPDRVDRLADGSYAVLDYKTGQVREAALGGTDDRPDDLQLAFYARHYGAPITAVAWAQIRSGDCRFRGVARDGGCLPGVRTAVRHLRAEAEDAAAWAQLEAAWDTALDTLVAEGRQGAARIEPQRDACRYCPLPGLCRIAEGGENTND